MSNAKKDAPSAKPAGSGKTGKRKAGGGTRFILIMIIVGALVPFGAPTLLLCLGFLPTLVALFTDTDPGKPALTAIGFLNVAGVAPFVIELWQKGQTMENAIHIMRQPATWLIMFGAAGIGQLLLYAVPTAIAMLTVARMEARLRTLREGLQHLQAIWGPDVSSAKSIEEIRKRDKA
jgi:hypothetical protein